MILDPDDCERFFKLHKALMLFVNQRLKVVKPPAKSAKAIVALPPDQRLKVRDAFLDHIDLIDAFVEKNPYKLDSEELGIVRTWKDLVAGEFYVFRYLKKYETVASLPGPIRRSLGRNRENRLGTRSMPPSWPPTRRTA